MLGMTQTKAPLSGFLAGLTTAPAVALGAKLRHSRFFHPTGVLARGEVRAADNFAPGSHLGEALAGPVFARFSSAWWKEHDWPDVLGCALRFTRERTLEARARIGEQDLLLATVRHPLTTLLAPLTTHVDDFLRNDYFGVSPFRFAVLGRIKLRLVPAPCEIGSGSREQRFLQALERGSLHFTLEARPDRVAARYRPVAEIQLFEHVPNESPELRFDPFANGRGLEPVGFVHAMRVAAYAASRVARGANTAH